MWNALLNALLGCSHRRTTFPMTPVRKGWENRGRTGTYVVCLDCGGEFDYDWKEMRMGAPVSRALAADARPSEANAFAPSRR